MVKAVVKNRHNDFCFSTQFLVQAQLYRTPIELAQISDRLATAIKGNLKHALSQKIGTSCLRNTILLIGQV